MTHQQLIQRFESGHSAGRFVPSRRPRPPGVCLSLGIPDRWKRSTASPRAAALRRRPREKSQLYHETITHAYFFLIRERMARSRRRRRGTSSPHRNPDLLAWKDGDPQSLLSRSTLQSDLARAVFLFPDKILLNTCAPELPSNKETAVLCRCARLTVFATKIGYDPLDDRKPV